MAGRSDGWRRYYFVCLLLGGKNCIDLLARKEGHNAVALLDLEEGSCVKQERVTMGRVQSKSKYSVVSINCVSMHRRRSALEDMAFFFQPQIKEPSSPRGGHLLVIGLESHQPAAGILVGQGKACHEAHRDAHESGALCDAAGYPGEGWTGAGA
jgi:hypothetical protein